MKPLFLTIIAAVFLAGCETPIPNNVSVEKGKEFAASQGYEDLRLESKKTLCHYNKGSSNSYGPTFSATLNGQDVKVTICEHSQAVLACEENDPLCNGPKTRLVRIDRFLIAKTH